MSTLRPKLLPFSACALFAVLSACSGGGNSTDDASSAGGSGSTPPGNAVQQHILFVGNSFTHGRYAPVRQYNSGGTQTPAGGSSLVIDDNAGQTGARAEDDETGPFGGIPGLFAEFASEAGFDYDVHIEAISSATLKTHAQSALDVIADAKWNAVVLQEQSTRPLPAALAAGMNSDPAVFCSSVDTLEQAIHGVAVTAAVYLYETWPRADIAQTLAGDASASAYAPAYAKALADQGDAFHDAYFRAAARNGKIAAVAPVGDAWARAWAQGVAETNPYAGTSGLPSLWYGIEAVNDPQISSPDRYHPSIYGAYLSALVLFQQITHTDARSLGSDEKAATALGIDSAMAAQLQRIAYETVAAQNSALVHPSADACTD